MSESAGTAIVGRRLLLEGVVIVFSILLAFAIDAWWSQKQERANEMRQLRSVSGELALNASMLETKGENLEAALAAVHEYLGWMSPNPQPVDTEQFAPVWSAILDIGTLSFLRRAIDDYLASSNNGQAGLLHLQEPLANWSYQADLIEKQYAILRAEHWELTQYLIRQPQAPLFAAELSLPLAGVKRSAFPFDQQVLLSDPVLESLLASYQFRLNLLIRRTRELVAEQTSLTASLASTLGDT